MNILFVISKDGQGDLYNLNNRNIKAGFEDNLKINFKYIINNENNHIIIIIKYVDTIFYNRSINAIHLDEIKNYLNIIRENIINRIFPNNEIEVNDFKFIIHELNYQPNSDLNITNYSIGGSGGPKKRWEILKKLSDENIDIAEVFKEIKKNFFCEEDLIREYEIIIATFKHDLFHLIGTLDTDFQGLLEEAIISGRNSISQIKWQQFVEIYGYKIDSIIKKLNDLIKFNIKKINDLIKTDIKKMSDRNELKSKFIFEKEIKNESFGIMINFFNDIKENKIKKISRMLLQDKQNNEIKNPIHQWLSELDQILNNFLNENIEYK